MNNFVVKITTFSYRKDGQLPLVKMLINPIIHGISTATAQSRMSTVLRLNVIGHGFTA